MNKHSLSAEARRKTILSIVLGVICVIYVLPVLTVVINSFKLNTYVKTDTFALPNAESFAGWANFIKGLTFGNYPFLKSAGYSLFITIVSTALILLCTSMAAWYIARVDSKFCRMVYYGRAVPDGDVHTVEDGRYSQAQHPLDHPHHLPRLWRGACDFHVRRLCQIHPA